MTEEERTAFRQGLEFMISFVEKTAEKFYEKGFTEYGASLKAIANGAKSYVVDFTNLYADLGYEGICDKRKEVTR